jgi:uncharacterized protein (DUF983 family)
MLGARRLNRYVHALAGFVPDHLDMPLDTIDSSGDASASRHVWQAMWRGFALRCPACGEGRLFGSFLKVAQRCPACGEALHHHRADDAPAYFTIVIVGHVIVGGVLSLERAFSPATWVHALVWLPLTLMLSLSLLPRVKGALVGLQWALRMHGFGGIGDPLDPPPAAEQRLPR